MIITSPGEWIKNTPILKITGSEIPETVNLYAKCEFINPAGGIKDRFGLYAIDMLWKQGVLRDGMTLIEATAGNTGLGLAFGAIGKNIKLIFVVPTKFSQEKQNLMRALGAKIVNTPAEDGMEGALLKAQELVQMTPDSLMIDQFKSELNAQSYYRSVAPEIYTELEGKIDVFVAGAGTGGTFSGIAQYFKEKNPNVWNVLADPLGSTLGGGESGHYRIEGIGNHFTPETFKKSLVNQVVKVSDQAAYQRVKQVAMDYGLFVGSSSGANLEAAIQMAKERKKGTIVTLFSDRGERYLKEGIYE